MGRIRRYPQPHVGAHHQSSRALPPQSIARVLAGRHRFPPVSSARPPSLRVRQCSMPGLSKRCTTARKQSGFAGWPAQHQLTSFAIDSRSSRFNMSN
jgi:hypothetical protein